MFTFTRWLIAPLFAGGMLVGADAETARADHGFRGGGFHISIGRSAYPSHYGHGYRSYVPSYGHGHHSIHHHRSHYRHGYYHDTSHYDWHPTEVYRHGNHYHVQPGHYDFHRSGHWHHH